MMAAKGISAIILVFSATLLIGQIESIAQDSTAKVAPQAKMLVDWQSSEIRTFLAQRATNPPLSLAPEDEARMAHLKLPVIAFDRPPGIVARAFGIDHMPERKRQLVTDPNSPDWYTIIDTYGDVTVTVEGDLRIQQRLPLGTQIYTPPQSLVAEPEVSVVDPQVEEGMEGIIAEYTIHKFPDIPYRVTIECSPTNKQHCADVKSILRDRSELRVISARPQ